MLDAVIEAHGLGKQYDGPESQDFWAVQGITLSVFASDVTVLMGPSGSGKTTLLSMFGGLLAPTAGYLSVCGIDLHECDEMQRQAFRRSNIGFVFQSYNLLASLTAEENVAIGLKMRGKNPNDAQEVLSQVNMDLKAKSYPHELSGGQRQRVAIARALAGDPPVLLADEPTAALDAEQGRVVMGLLRRRAKENGTAVLIVTHDPRVREFSDRAIEMEDGQLRRIIRRHRTLVGANSTRSLTA